jgi:exopolysaccharide production protein ExoQ
MTELYGRPQFATAHRANVPGVSTACLPWNDSANVFAPVSQQVLTWLLFFPLLTLIARRIVYFAGPAHSDVSSQLGSAMGGTNGSRYGNYLVLLFFFGFVVAGHRGVWAVLRRNLLIVAVLSLAVCSLLWTVSPQITFNACIQVGLCTLFACYLSERITTERLMNLLMFVGSIAAVLSVLFALFLPSYGVTGDSKGEWIGICSHKNELGVSMAFLLTPVFFTNCYSRQRKLVYSALLLFLIYKSQSRGAWSYTAGMLVFVAWLNLIRRLRAREVPPLLLITVTIAAAILVFGLYFWPMIATSMGKDPTMTGRGPIYVEVWRSILKHPVLGYGFGAFWYQGNFEAKRIGIAIRWPGIGYAESGILEMALQIGFVGVGLIVVMIGKAIRQGTRLLRTPQYSARVGWFVTILFLAVLTNVDAGWFMTMNTLDWVLILIACIGLNRETALA